MRSVSMILINVKIGVHEPMIKYMNENFGDDPLICVYDLTQVVSMFLYTVALVFNSISFIYKAVKMRGDDDSTRRAKKSLRILVSVILSLFFAAFVFRSIGECVNEFLHPTFVLDSILVFQIFMFNLTGISAVVLFRSAFYINQKYNSEIKQS